MSSLTTQQNGETHFTDYFSSYGDISVHQLMLKDVPRTLAYKKFFENNHGLIENKTVLDIGAGTGILSLFAASAGAGKVYAVEASSVADLCQEIVKCNGYEDKICVLHGTIEDVKLPEGTKVDVIVSEWMGFYLLHESMLDSVIYAREKYLSSDGIIIPSHAALYISPVNMEFYCDEHYDYWKNVYGFDFSPVIPTVVKKSQEQPVITEVSQDQLLSSAQKICDLNLKNVQMEDVQKISSCLTFTIHKSSFLHGYVSWFDVDLRTGCDADGVVSPVTLSTSPKSPVTHWKQTIFMLPEAVSVEKGNEVSCQVEFSQDESNKRHYNISIELLSPDDEEEEFSDEGGEDHPIPCDCDAPRCKLIKAVMEKYDEEHRELEVEAEIIDVTAGMAASEALDSEMANDCSINGDGEREDA